LTGDSLVVARQASFNLTFLHSAKPANADASGVLALVAAIACFSFDTDLRRSLLSKVENFSHFVSHINLAASQKWAIAVGVQ